MSYKLIFESSSTLWCRFFGKIDFADATMATNEFYSDPRSDETRVALWDFSEISGFNVSQIEVSEIAAIDDTASTYMKPLKVAFITRDPELAILTRHYIQEMALYGNRWDNRLFESIDEARRWAASA